MQCPLPSRCFTEQRPRPLVGQPPPAVGASIEFGRCVEHAPQGFLAQPDMRAGPQRIERGEGDRPCLIPRGATPFQARGRVVLDPALALAVADQNSGRGESCIPGRRGPLSPASDEPVLEIDSRECRNRHLGTERLDQGTIGRPIGSARRRRQITVGKEGLDGGPEGRFRGVETSGGGHRGSQREIILRLRSALRALTPLRYLQSGCIHKRY